MTEDKLLYLGIDVLVLLLVQLQLMATLSRSIFMIMDLNSVALSGVKAGSPRATEQQSCTQGKKKLIGGPQNNFRHFFHSFLPFFQRFLPFFVVFRRFRCFSAVVHPFSLFLTVFHSFFILFHRPYTVFSTAFSWIFFQDILDFPLLPQ